jgi:ribonuclease R
MTTNKRNTGSRRRASTTATATKTHSPEAVARPRQRNATRAIRAPRPQIEHDLELAPSMAGIFSVHPRGFGFVASGTDEEDVFVPAPLVRGKRLYTGDHVVVRYNEDRRAAFEITLVTRVRTRVFGTLIQQGNTPRVVPDPWVSADYLTPRAGQLEGIVPGEGVLVGLTGDREVTSYGLASAPRALRARALERFRRGELDTNVAIPTPDTSITRRDLESLVTFTIDGPGSRDLDDALSAQRRGDNIALFVHIADVASAVPVGSPADLRARSLATSVYLPGYSLPMFPPELSYDECSLLPDVRRRTLTVEYEVTPEGAVENVALYHASIKSDARLTYEQAAGVLAGTEVLADPLQRSLFLVHEATTRLESARAARGGLSSDRYEPPLDLSVTDTAITVVPADEAQIAHDLIEEAMVAANEAVAAWLIDQALPGIYRTHPAPGPEVIAAIEALASGLGIPVTPGPVLTPQSLALVDAQLRAHPGPAAPLWAVVAGHLDRATYQTTPGHHFGLASEAYVHFTSPIRRYADLTVHRIITAHLTGRALPTHLEKLCEHINEASSLAARTETAARSLLWAAYLRSLPAAARENMDARVVKVAEKGIVVALDQFGASGWILSRDLDSTGVDVDEHNLTLTGRRRGKWSLGMPLVVRVAEIDIEAGQVTFLPA